LLLLALLFLVGTFRYKDNALVRVVSGCLRPLGLRSPAQYFVTKRWAAAGGGGGVEPAGWTYTRTGAA
jgi:hypothetical protein